MLTGAVKKHLYYRDDACPQDMQLGVPPGYRITGRLF